MYQQNEVKFETLKGLTLYKIENIGEQVIFHTNEGRVFRQYHYEACCESVSVEDIIGDLDDLIGTPILEASVETSNTNPVDAKPETLEYRDSFTWTFYKLSTIKGSVTIRWYGSSNGYYSEEVTFEEIK